MFHVVACGGSLGAQRWRNPSCWFCWVGALAVLILFGVVEASAQNSRLYELCPPDEGQPPTVCREFIVEHFPDHQERLLQLRDGIDARKDQSRTWARADTQWLVASQWLMVFLGALVTIMISLDKLGRVDLRRWAILPSAAVAGVSALLTFYDFGQSLQDNIEAQTAFATVLDDLHFDLLSAVEGGDLARVNDAFVERYRLALRAGVIDRKDAFLRLSEERAKAAIENEIK